MLCEYFDQSRIDLNSGFGQWHKFVMHSEKLGLVGAVSYFHLKSCLNINILWIKFKNSILSSA